VTRWLCPHGHELELGVSLGDTLGRIWRCPIDGFTMTEKDLVETENKLHPRRNHPEKLDPIKLTGSVTISKLAARSIQGALRRVGMVNEELDRAIEAAPDPENFPK